MLPNQQTSHLNVNSQVEYLSASLFSIVAMAVLLILCASLMAVKTKQTRTRRRLRDAQYDPMPELSNKHKIFGHALEFKNRVDTLLDFVQTESLTNKTFRCTLPCSPPVIMTSDPMVNQRILSSGFKEGVYQKPRVGLRQLSEILGQGIFLSDGKVWQRQRAIATPLFHKMKLQSYVPLFVDNALRLIDILNAKTAASASAVDLQDYFYRYTLDTFCEIGFGVRLNSMNNSDLATRFFHAMTCIQKRIEARMKTGELWRATEFFFKDHQFVASIEFIDAFLYELIRQRRAEDPEDVANKPDLLSQLLSQKETLLSDKELRDIVMNLLIAGRDSTALTMTWSIFEACRDNNRGMVNRMIDEICEVLQISTENFTAEYVTKEFISEKFDFEFQKKLKFMHKYIQEVLRLYPPVPINAFETTRDDVLTTSDGKNYFIEKGTVCLYSAYTSQRHPDNFDDPLTFNPDRFDRPLKPFSYLSFNGGPRICLGQEMAYVEAKILFACLLSQFQFEIKNIDEIKPKQSFLLTSEKGLPVNITPRD